MTKKGHTIKFTWPITLAFKYLRQTPSIVNLGAEKEIKYKIDSDGGSEG